MTIQAIDYFCGAGGLTRGLLDAEIAVLGGVDVDDRLEETYGKNNKPARFICADVMGLKSSELHADLGVDRNHPLLYAACTPCQPFSTLNQRKGVDKRKNLLLAFGKLVAEQQPDFVLVENVPGLGNAYGREIYTKFLKLLAAGGLVHHDAKKLDAVDYQVPQVRKRFILIASRHGPISLPPRADGEPGTVKDAISHLEDLVKGAPPNHVARPVRPHHRRILEAVPADGGSRADVKDTSILLKCHQEQPGVHKDVFGRMAWDSPAPTLTARCTDVYCGRFAHPIQHRGMTVREAAALQTFRDDYEFFYDSIFHGAQQVGNAVPVKFAEHLGRRVRQAAEALS